MSRSGPLLCVVVVGAWILAGCAVPVAVGLDEGDANRVVVALDQAGIDAIKEADPVTEGKFRVNVPREDVVHALSTMADEQLPRPKTRGILDATARGQLLPSQAAEHAELVAGMSGELERTLGNVDGVLSARVHLNLPPNNGLRDGPPPKSTASVLVEHKGDAPPLTAESIQRLVAGGAPSLAPADVAVVFVPYAPRLSPQSRAEITHVGPIAVLRTSAATLKIAFVALLLMMLGFGAIGLALYAKLAQVRRELENRDARAARASSP